MALTPFELDPTRRPDIGFRPGVLEPMFQAAERGRDLMPAVRKIVARLGFDSFMYGLTASEHPTRTSQVYFFATLPSEWALLYDEKSYVEIDPRISMAQKNSSPALWDRLVAIENSPTQYRRRLDEFFVDAARYGIRSGVAWGLRDRDRHGVLICLNSSAQVFGSSERERLARNIGDILAFGTYFHEFFVRNFVDRGMPSRLRGATLSIREIEILGMVAHGLRSDDIAHKFDITPRTVRFHVDTARTKMGALNRDEAIAMAAKAGLISPMP
jgi:LuxR family transcriptional regulator, quorum-sensing system regulator SdiA